MSTLDSTHFLPHRPPLTTLGPGHQARPLKAASANAYQKDLRQFREVFKGCVPCDQRMVERYIASLRNQVQATTIYRRLMSLRHEHIRLGHPSPTDLPGIRPMLRQLQKGILPSKPGAKATPTAKRKEPRKAKPLTRSLLARILDAMGIHKIIDRRDRCLLLLGFSAALSRSALVSLDVSDLEFTRDVMIVHLREFDDRTRTRTVTVPITGGEMCAAVATRDLIQHAALDIEGGPLLRNCDRAGDLTRHRLSASWVSAVVKNRLRAAGVDPADFSGLSLKRGRLMEMARGTL